MSEETMSGRLPLRDEATCVGIFRSDELPERAPGPREAFIVAYDRIVTLAALASRPSVVVAAVTPQLRVLEAVLVADGHALTIGRHSRCGLRLSAPRVALRQVAVLVHSEAGATVTRVWDLNTSTPFLTEDGQPNSALVSNGPLHIAMEPYSLWFIPSAVAARLPSRAGEAWSALPERLFIDRRPAAQAAPEPRKPRPAVLARAPQGLARDGIEREISHVTLVGPPLLLESSDPHEIGWGVLRIEQSAERRQHQASAERLDRGILVGRYERCGLGIGLEDDKVSRVHALIVKIGGDVWAIDTASTNGLWRGGTAFDARILGDIETLSLGNATTVRWRRLKHPQA